MKIHVSSTHDFTFTVNLPQLADLLVVLGGTSIPRTLARIEARMATFEENLARMEQTLDAFDQREAQEDADHVLSKAEVERLTAELAALKAEMEAGTLTPERQARFDALLKRIEDNNKIPDEVLPEPTEPPAE